MIHPPYDRLLRVTVTSVGSTGVPRHDSSAFEGSPSPSTRRGDVFVLHDSSWTADPPADIANVDHIDQHKVDLFGLSFFGQGVEGTMGRCEKHRSLRKEATTGYVFGKSMGISF